MFICYIVFICYLMTIIFLPFDFKIRHKCLHKGGINNSVKCELYKVLSFLNVFVLSFPRFWKIVLFNGKVVVFNGERIYCMREYTAIESLYRIWHFNVKDLTYGITVNFRKGCTRINSDFHMVEIKCVILLQDIGCVFEASFNYS